MDFAETMLYFVLFVGLAMASLYYSLTGQDLAAINYFVGVSLVGAWVMVRLLWVATAHNRRLRKILNEIERRRTQG